MSPTVLIQKFASGDCTTPMTAELHAMDNVAVTRVEMLFDGVVVAVDTRRDDGWQLSWAHPVFSGEQHTLETRAYDAAGNVGRNPVDFYTASRTASDCAGYIPFSQNVVDGMMAFPGDHKVVITANGFSNQFDLYWSTDPAATQQNMQKIAGISLPFIHSGLQNGVRHYYRLVMGNGGLWPFPSAMVSAVPSAAARSGVDECRGGLQLTVSSIPVSAPIAHQRYTERIMEGSQLSAAALPDGSTMIAWSAGSTATYLTRVDGNGQRVGADIPVDGMHPRGLTVLPDGIAMLVARSQDRLAFVKYNYSGQKLFDTPVIGGCDETVSGCRWTEVNFNGEEDDFFKGDVLWDGSRFVLYFGKQENYGTTGVHHNDTVRFFDANGNFISSPYGDSGGFCGHSRGRRLAWNSQLSRWGAVCTTDDSYAAFGIANLGYASVPRLMPAHACTTDYTSLMGGLVPIQNGFGVLFASNEDGRSSLDVFYSTILQGADGLDVVTTRAIHETPWTHETFVQLGRLGSGLLAQWKEQRNEDRTAYVHVNHDALGWMQRMDERGDALGAPVLMPLTSPRNDNLIAYPNGDAGWVQATGNIPALTVVRVRACSN